MVREVYKGSLKVSSISRIGVPTIRSSRDEAAALGESVQKQALRLDLYNHSPTGFEWGYWGSGPAQLALAMLADCLASDEQALLYQRYGIDLSADERLILGNCLSGSWIDPLLIITWPMKSQTASGQAGQRL